jgi:hypothetical protein
MYQFNQVTQPLPTKVERDGTDKCAKVERKKQSYPGKIQLMKPFGNKLIIPMVNPSILPILASNTIVKDGAELLINT